MHQVRYVPCALDWLPSFPLPCVELLDDDEIPGILFFVALPDADVKRLRVAAHRARTKPKEYLARLIHASLENAAAEAASPLLGGRRLP